MERTSKETMYVNDIFKTMNKLNNPESRYDIIFHLPPVIKPVNDGVRSKEQFDDNWRDDKNKEIEYIASGGRERVVRVEYLRWLPKIIKYGKYYNNILPYCITIFLTIS